MWAERTWSYPGKLLIKLVYFEGRGDHRNISVSEPVTIAATPQPSGSTQSAILCNIALLPLTTI